MSHIISAGSINGPHHRIRNEENQDYFYHITENGITVIAVADGAGSLSQSHIGAKLASTTAVCETIDAILDGNNLESAVQIGVDRARDTLLDRDDRKQIGCTLAVAVISDQGWAAGVVGDAFAVISLADDSHQIIQPTSDSEFANITKLLTSKDYSPMYRSGTESALAVSAASDGLLQASLKDGKPLAGFWTPIVKRASEEAFNVSSFLEHMDANEKISDDTTLVVAAA